MKWMNIFKGIKNLVGCIVADSPRTININGKSYKGSTFTVSKNTIMIDGEVIDDNSRVVNIQVTGDVSSVYTTSGDITVHGNTGSIKSTSGDVDISGDISGSVSTVSGDVSCGSVSSVSTVSGDIERG
jgi:hypothetical protein